MDFDTVCGQKHVTDVLKYQVANGKISHAYLFCGSRGTGKTSCAKIMAKAVNCEHPVNGNPCNECEACRSINEGLATDVIEMDAASNNGVDNVRDIRDAVVFTPAALRYRVYIIDEVHMLSPSAFNALLKTLEEPPAHVVFILATTELQKLPSTIISRCQRYDFRRMTTNILSDRLKTIAAAEGIDLDDSGALLISRMAQGGMRDAISLLELCAGTGEKIDERSATEILGAPSREAAFAMIRAVAAKDYDAIYAGIADVVMQSRDLSVFWQELLDTYRDMMLVKTSKAAKEYLDITDGEYEALSQISALFSMETLLYHSKMMEDTLIAMQRVGFTKRSAAELTLTRMCEPRLSSEKEAMLARIGKLEEEVARLKLGVPIPTASAEPTPAPKEENKEQKNDPAPAKPAPEPNAANEYRPLGCWSEVVEALSVRKPSVAGFLSKTKAYHSPKDGYLVRTASDFIVNILSAPDMLLDIKSLISEYEGRNIAAEPFKVCAAQGAADGDPLGELEDILQNS